MYAGKGTFTAAVEVQGQKQLVVSFLHHQPVQRLSHNPLEHQDVVGVTNYLDVGLQVCLAAFMTSMAGCYHPPYKLACWCCHSKRLISSALPIHMLCFMVICTGVECISRICEKIDTSLCESMSV